jgi:hypothetical protein
VRRGEVEVEKERPRVLRTLLEHRDCPVAEELGQVAGLADVCGAVPQVRQAIEFVGEIVDPAAADAPELVEPAPERTVIRQLAEVPLADERGGIAAFAQQRGQGGVLGRQADRAALQRLLEPDRQAVLVASGQQRDPRRRAHRAVGVGLREAHPLPRKPVDRRGRVFAAAVATQVGIAEVVGHDEHDAGRDGGHRARGLQRAKPLSSG